MVDNLRFPQKFQARPQIKPLGANRPLPRPILQQSRPPPNLPGLLGFPRKPPITSRENFFKSKKFFVMLAGVVLLVLIFLMVFLLKKDSGEDVISCDEDSDCFGEDVCSKGQCVDYTPNIECEDGDTRGCGSSDIGECAKGLEACIDGEWSGICDGQIVPELDICDGKDNDCDGRIDDDGVCDSGNGNGNNTICQSGNNRSCGVDYGECVKGIETCVNGNWSGSCVGAINPVNETCDGKDNDCDLLIDEGNVCQINNTICQNNTKRVCGTDIGECSYGNETCVSGNWSGVCAGAVNPLQETCDQKDNDCDGIVDDGDVCAECTNRQNRTCGTNVGECDSGIQICAAQKWSECFGDIGPVQETCADELDNDCDGVINNNCVRTNGYMQLYYPFNESSGSIAYDYFGKYNGSIIGNVPRVQGKIGGAYDFFNPSRVHVEPAPKILDNQFTFEAWIKPSVLDWTQTILDSRVDYGRQNLLFQFAGYSDDCLHALAFTIYGATIDVKSTSCGNYWLDGHWHHFAVTYDNSTLRLYVDGINEASKNVSNIRVSISNASMDIGWQEQYPFKGAIDEFKLWNYAKTDF